MIIKAHRKSGKLDANVINRTKHTCLKDRCADLCSMWSYKQAVISLSHVAQKQTALSKVHAIC